MVRVKRGSCWRLPADSIRNMSCNCSEWLCLSASPDETEHASTYFQFSLVFLNLKRDLKTEDTDRFECGKRRRDEQMLRRLRLHDDPYS